MIKDASAGGSGKISFNEFFSMMTEKMRTAPKPIPFTRSVVPSKTTKAGRQIDVRVIDRAECATVQTKIASKATIVQVTRHASRMSASANRPRITVQAVVA